MYIQKIRPGQAAERRSRKGSLQCTKAVSANACAEMENIMKRLTKSRDKKLCGVCGGIAEYFDIDPTVVRLIWVLLVLCAGTGVLAYIIAALVMPEK